MEGCSYTKRKVVEAPYVIAVYCGTRDKWVIMDIRGMDENEKSVMEKLPLVEEK